MAVVGTRRDSAHLVELSLAAGGFAIGVGEFAIMGLLPNIARGFDITVPQAGHAISFYALGVVVGAPVIAVLAARLPRKTLLIGLMAVFALGNLLSALAPDYRSFVVLRFLSGLPHGAYFGVASLVAAGMVDPSKRTQAVGRVMLGLTVAILVGTPLVTWAGQIFTWRLMFAAVAAIAMLTIAMIWRFLSHAPAEHGASPLRELRAFTSLQVWLTVATGAVGFGGLFAVFSYIAPTMTQVAGMPESMVPFVMAIFGGGMIVGMTFGAWLADRDLVKTIAGFLLFSVLALALFSITAGNAWLLCLFVFFVACGDAIAPALQTRLMDVAAEAQTLAAALNHSAFNIANALGAWLGGLAITWGYGYASTGWVGSALALGGLLIFLLSVALDRGLTRRADPQEA
jgi:MFS transporter, DHA1 family, inner membrane transport protein